MDLFDIASFTCIGIVAGLLSGLLGIGGGIVIIPGLLLVFKHLNISSEPMYLAIGTSLTSTLFTTCVASFAHYKKQGILFAILKPMSLGVCCGAVLGAYIARLLPNSSLQIAFAILECAIGIRLFFPTRIASQGSLPNSWFLSITAGGISTLSALLGIGGGLLYVPILCFFNVPIKQAIGTSSALSFLTCFIGAISFFFFTLCTHGVQGWSMCLYFPAWITISAVAMVAAPLGVRLTHTLSTYYLRKILGIALVITGIMMIVS